MADDFDADLKEKDFDADLKPKGTSSQAEADLGAAEPAPTFGGLAGAAGKVLNTAADVVTTPAQVAIEAVKDPPKFAGRVRSAMDGATAGLYGKGVSALEALSPSTTYAQAKAENLPLVEQAVKDNPLTNLAGSLASPAVKLPAAGFVARGLVGGGNALAQSLLRHYGHSKEEGLDALDKGTIPEAALNTALGTAGGVATGPWSKLADDMALRAAGMRGGISNKLQKAGYRTSEDAAELGNAIRKEGLVPWLGGAPEVAANARALKSSSGQRIGGALDAAQASGVAPDFQAPVVTARKGLMQESPVLRPAGEKLRSYLDALEGAPKQLVDDAGMPRPATWRDLNEGKSSAWDAANFDADAKGAPRLYRQGVGRVAGDMQRQVEAAAGPKVARELAEGNRQFGVASDIEKISNDAATRDAAKQSAMPGAIQAAMVGAAGAGAGGASGGVQGGLLGGLTGLGTYAATHLAKTHGPAFMTRSAQMLEPLEAAIENAPGGTSSDALQQYFKYLDDKKEESP